MSAWELILFFGVIAAVGGGAWYLVRKIRRDQL